MTVGAASSGSQVGSFGFLITVSACTLVRTRGWLTARVRTSGVANNQIQGALGLIVVSENAFSTGGLAALPIPLDDVENDWFVYQPFAFIPRAASTIANDLSANYMAPIDSRGQRKLKEGDALAVLVEVLQSDATTGTIIDFSYALRMQCKL